MLAFLLVVLTLLAASPADAGALGCPLGEAPSATAMADVEACFDASPGDDAPDDPGCPEGGCCPACAPCCTRAAWSQEAMPRAPDGVSTGTLSAEAESRPGAGPTGAVWHPPRS